MRGVPHRTKKRQDPPAAPPPPASEPPEQRTNTPEHTRPDIVRPAPSTPPPEPEPAAPQGPVVGAHKKRSRFARRKQIVAIEPVVLPARSGLTQPLDREEHVTVEPKPEPNPEPKPEAEKPAPENQPPRKRRPRYADKRIPPPGPGLQDIESGSPTALKAARPAPMTPSQRRSMAHRRGRQAPPAAPQPRVGLLLLVIMLGLLIAAVAVTGGLIAASLHDKSRKLASPLLVYPVTQVVTGQCPAGTRGVTGTTPSGPACYQVSNGIAIRKVADIRVQRRQGQNEVAINLLAADRRAFARLTQASVGRDVALVVRDQLVTAPRVDMPITGGKIIIAGEFTPETADQLVRRLTGS